MNWMKFGWGEEFDSEFHPNKKLHIDVSSIEYTTERDDLLSVSSLAISEIANQYPPPYYLMVSGGIDSQAMLWCWKNSSVPFIPVSVRYHVDDSNVTINQHDLDELEIFASQQNIDITHADLNIVNFLENELEQYATKYQCTSPQICTHMKIAELVDGGTVIFSGNFIDNFTYTYTIMGLKRYADTSNRSCIPFFFLHDRRLAGFSGKTRDETPYKEKVEFYKKIGIPIVPQIKKQTGFELIKDYYDTRDDLIVTTKDRIRFSSMPSKRKFDLLFRYALSKQIKYRDEIVILNKNSKY